MVKVGNTEKTDNKSAFDRGKAVGLAGVWGSKAPDAVNSFLNVTILYRERMSVWSLCERQKNYRLRVNVDKT